MRIKERLRSDTWPVMRIATLDEVEKESGKIIYHVEVRDDVPGRKPFISRWFNDIAPASDLYDHVRGEGNDAHGTG